MFVIIMYTIKYDSYNYLILWGGLVYTKVTGQSKLAFQLASQLKQQVL